MSNRTDQLKQYLSESPDDAFLNYALAIEMVGEENDIEAEKIFRRLLEIHPNYSATYYHLGKLLERKKAKDEAISMYETGISVSKANNEMHQVSELQSALLELEYSDEE